MQDYIELGAAPYDESCASIGTSGFCERNMFECRLLIAQLRRQLGPEQGSARLVIRSNRHDFGVYREVACCYDNADELGKKYAFRAEGEYPANWDRESLETLERGGYVR